MVTALFIEGRRDGYSPSRCGKTFTVGELRDWLEQFDEEIPVYLNNDNGYTYGRITEYSFMESEYDPEEE